MNNKISKILGATLCVALAVMMFAGCTTTKKEKEEDLFVATPVPNPENIMAQITLSSYLYDEDADTITSYITEFNSKYPGVEVVVQHDDVSADAYFDQLDERIESGTIGSVFLIDNERMAKYAAEGKIISLDKYFNDLLNYDSYQKIDPSKDLLPAAYNAGLYNGDLYMAGLEYNHKFVFLNYSLIEEAGCSFPKDDWSWDDLIEMAETVKAKGTDTPIAMDYNDYSIWGAFARSHGADIYETIGGEGTDKALNLTDPDVVEGIEDLAKLAKSGLVDCVDASDIAAEDISKYAFIVADHDDVSRWSEYLTSEECTFEWDYAHFPRWNESAENTELYYQSIGAEVYGLAVYNYGITEEYTEEYYKACATLALYAMVDNAAVNYAGDGESVPANKNVNGMKFWREFPTEGKNSSVFSLFAEKADFADNLSSFMPVTSASEISLEEIIKNYTDTASLEASLQKLQDLANAGWIED